jgi:septum site-determining protein MinC
MAAVLIPGIRAGEPHRLRLPERRGAAGPLEEVRYGLGATAQRGTVLLEAGDWGLRLSELRALSELLAGMGLELRGVCSQRPETLVAAAALGLDTEAAPPAPQPYADGDGGLTAAAPDLLIHRGTLRSGDHLQSDGSLLLLGDVNPGARLSARGHVLVWGRLRGVAHAGRDGDRDARITALQLRPLQLRIADAVARGPEEAPAPGQAEEARLVAGEIRIDPASPCWPLSD